VEAFYVAALLGTISIFPCTDVRAQQTPALRTKAAALQDVELQTPFVVRTVKGIIRAEDKPLQGASVWLQFENGVIINANSNRDGSFEFQEELDPPLFRLLHPQLHTELRHLGAKPGTYRLKVTKPGYHSLVATVIVSASVAEEDSIEIQLQPGPRAKAEVLEKDPHPREALEGMVVDPGEANRRKYRYSTIDMPVSLAPGTVETEAFSVQREAYFIMIQAHKRLPFREMVCMMGVTSGPLDAAECNEDPLLQAEWTVWDGDDLVAYGMNRLEAEAEFTDEHIFKFLGTFMGDSGKKYVVQVKFTTDASRLNATYPHLIVIPTKDH
jgi:hypothetical protein